MVVTGTDKSKVFHDVGMNLMIKITDLLLNAASCDPPSPTSTHPPYPLPPKKNILVSGIFFSHTVFNMF